ncbi:MAG: protein-disulfide reductase DsbD N-terminal domain-containing protein [Muribaculaceae bacterium]|nr:protein-disulfide reductase DsbD N-terminal domain-containing protein [Muribaculaceae bacterium]
MDLRKIALTLLLIIAALLPLAAAEPGVAPVRWRTIIKTTGPNTGTVTFRALVAPGWHLYAQELPAGGPKPTTFALDGSSGLRFDGPVKASRPALEVQDPLFGMTLAWWDANVDFTVPFTVTDEASARINAKITYMACDGTSCMPPATESIATPVKLKKK